MARLPLARPGALPVTARGLDLAFGRDHTHPMDHHLEELRQRQVPEPAMAAIVRGAAARRAIEDLLNRS